MPARLKTVGSGGAAESRRLAPPTRLLLMAGFVAVGLYGIGDLVSGLLYEGYSYRDQAISELTAFGSPVRLIMVAVILVHGLLVLAFGVGVYRSADRTGLRWIGLLQREAWCLGYGSACRLNSAIAHDVLPSPVMDGGIMWRQVRGGWL